MSADDQAFLDALNSVPRNVVRWSNDIADYIDTYANEIAAEIRDHLTHAQWLPESVRPTPPPPSPSAIASSLPVSIYDKVRDTVKRNKVLTGTFVVGFGASVYMMYRRRAHYARKRRAKRAPNGARLEVVVIAGSPHEPIVRSLALDLERRGFIVFIVCNDVDEELQVQNEARNDIRPLMVDVSDPHGASNNIERFASLLHTPQHAFEGAKPHHLQFTSLILIPTLNYPSAPIATISPSHISDLLNTRLLHPVLLAQAFLPLLTTPPQAPPVHGHISPYAPPPPGPPRPPKLLLLTPSIISSLSPPFHAPESAITAALSAFVRSLTLELRPLGVPVTHIQLGAFDTSSFHPKNQLQTLAGSSAQTRAWPEGAREAYGSNFLKSARASVGLGQKRGSNLRELHNAVFDEMAKSPRRAGGVVRVGQGAGLYAFVGAWAPRGLVAWMLGVRKVPRRPGSSTSSQSDGGSEKGMAEENGAGESDTSFVDVEAGGKEWMA